MGDVDTLLALMGGEEPPPPPPSRAAGTQRAAAPRPGRGPPGRQELDAQASKELWNPSVRWNPPDGAAAVEPLRLPSARVELARQTAVRSLQARFKAQCTALNTGWSEPEVNKHFECWMLDSSVRRAADSSGIGDPLLPPPKTAGDDPGLRKQLFASARLQRKAVSRFMSDMQKAVTKAHRTVAQLSAAGGGAQKRSVRVSPATVTASDSQQWERAHEQRQQPMLGWDGKAMLQIRYGSTSVLINQCHWDKLAAMVRLELGEAAAKEPAERDIFKERVLCLLVRYNSLQGGGVHGGGFQAAIPDHVFDTLLRHFDVCFECFASPLNSRYPHFCSAFPDTDAPFGSLGSFFNFKPRAGSFEANPPFVPNLILKMAEHMHQLLVRADGDDSHAETHGESQGEEAQGSPLCFIVIIPSWDETMGWRALNESPFLTHHLRLAQREHGYTEGAQHCRRSRYRISVGDTSVFFLQSKAAQRKWPVTPEVLEDIQAAFTSKHNTDRQGSDNGDAEARQDTDGAGDAPVGGISNTQQLHHAAQEREEQEEEEEEEQEEEVQAMGTQRVVREAVQSDQRNAAAQSAKTKSGGKKRKHSKREEDTRKKKKKKKRRQAVTVS
jgi:hypothetical protein